MTCGWFAAPRAPEGIDGPPSALPWLGLPLRERQERAFLEARLPLAPGVVGASESPAAESPAAESPAAESPAAESPAAESPAPGDPDAGPRLLVREDVAITQATVRDALALARQGAGDQRFVLGGRSGAFLDEICLGRDEPLLVFLDGGRPSMERVLAARPVELDPRERLVQVPVPGEAGADVIELPLTERIMHPTGHWLQLLWANLLGLAPFLWRGLAGRNVVETGIRLGWAVVRAASLDPARVGARLVRRGRGCRVHPSAVVEGCWLGDGVEIGANAVVRASVLADGAIVEDQALAEFVVLGPGARVQRQGLAKLSVVGARAAVGGMIQLAVVDREAQVKLGAHLMDMAVDQGVRVRTGGRLVEAPLGLAGVCVGRGTVVGAGLRVAPGRALPPHLAILPPLGDVIQRIPDRLHGTVTVSDGTLVGLGRGRG